MSSTSSSDKTKVTTSLPSFNGTNYREWADAIKAFMRFNGTWFLIEGYGSKKGTIVPGMARPTPTTSPNNAAEVAAWDEKNDKALGTILLYVEKNLKHHVEDAYTALEAWEALKNEYEKPGAVGAFVAFQKLFNLQLSDSSSLGPQIDAMIQAANEVNNAGIAVADQLLAATIEHRFACCIARLCCAGNRILRGVRTVGVYRHPSRCWISPPE